MHTRFQSAQQDRTFRHPSLPQDTHAAKSKRLSAPYTFVVAADTQLGMMDQNSKTKDNKESYAEVEYSRRAIAAINKLNPRPLFCCICGDLVDMTSGIYTNTPKATNESSGEDVQLVWTKEECDTVQDEQFQIFQETWEELHHDIPLICLCGNHDVGNRPNAASIERFREHFGDDYFAFWANGSYSIVINSSLISQPDDAMELYETQLQWIEERLLYAKEAKAAIVFVFSHHPIFLYDEDEDETQLTGTLTIQWPPADAHRYDPQLRISESYFPLPRVRRKRLLDLFAKYHVAACFAGHFHQNLIRTTSFGMDMITTGPLSLVLPSNNNPSEEPFSLGFRLVHVQQEEATGKCVLDPVFVPL